MISSRFAPVYASMSLFLFLSLLYPLAGRDVFVGLAGISLIAWIHLFLRKQSH